MSVFAYNPDAVKTWASSIINSINGGSDSISGCSKKFSEQIEKLVQPNVWTGAAASKNYQNFLEAHQALIKFANNFGNAYEEAINSINKNVANLEVANLGSDTNVSSSFGTLTYEQINVLSEQNISKEIVRYDYATISEIGTALNSILNDLESVNNNLNSRINELNNGSGMWDGTASEKAKESLSNTLKTNMDKVMEILNICISNISKAAEAARTADAS